MMKTNWLLCLYYMLVTWWRYLPFAIFEPFIKLWLCILAYNWYWPFFSVKYRCLRLLYTSLKMEKRSQWFELMLFPERSGWFRDIKTSWRTAVLVIGAPYVERPQLFLWKKSVLEMLNIYRCRFSSSFWTCHSYSSAVLFWVIYIHEKDELLILPLLRHTISCWYSLLSWVVEGTFLFPCSRSWADLCWFLVKSEIRFVGTVEKLQIIILLSCALPRYFLAYGPAN